MKLYIGLLSIIMSGNVLAHGPTPQKTDESVQLKATPDAVWKKIIEPCGITKWNVEVTACDVVSDKQQTLTLKNGKKLLQEVDEIAMAEMTYSYRLSGEIDISALPVSSLHGKIKVTPDEEGSKVRWTARYYRAFTGNEPPAGQDDESAKNAIDQFVKTGLNGLKENKTSAKANINQSANATSCCAGIKNFLKKVGLNF